MATSEFTVTHATDEARRLREHYLHDPHRPGYHFVVPEGTHCPVDPNGALYWNGRYHLCYIYQHEGKHYWGHISSIDLVHWRHHLPALAPGEGDEGIFSGGACIDQESTATITYWRLGKPDGIAIARSTHPQLEHWDKDIHNPVIPSQEMGWSTVTNSEGFQVPVGTADPSAIWFHNGRYYLLTGNLPVLREFGEKRGISDHLGDTAYLFVSDDLISWTYLHPFYQSRRDWTFDFEDCMCPDFFPLPSSAKGSTDSNTYMLLFISHTLGCQYYLGSYHDNHFYPETHGRMSWPPDPEQYRTAGFHDHGYFAPESLRDANGRRIMWAWIFDHRSAAVKQRTGWSGELSLPRILWHGEDNTLRMEPAEELQMLRYNHQQISNLHLTADCITPVKSMRGNSLELLMACKPGQVTQVGIHVCRSDNGEESTSIYYDVEARTLNIDTRSSSKGEGRKQIESAPFSLAIDETFNLRVFIDKSIIEVFANEHQAMAARIYPTAIDSLGIACFANGADGMITSLDSWEMMATNPW